MTTTAGTTGVWADLIGQDRVVETLQRAVRAAGAGGNRHAMSHAWLLTGPPGSGRSNAARAFAAALQCAVGGCGECNTCITSLSGAHPDVTLVRTEALSIGVDEVRELVRRAAMAPTMGRYQVLVVEDADRITERGADALLKSIEEPAAITELLRRRDGVEPELAAFAARVAQGHIGRARALARNPSVRERRQDVLRLPGRLRSLGTCLDAAATLVEAATQEATVLTAELDARERTELSEALGLTTRGVRPRNAQAALRELEDQQKARAKRIQRDALDRVLTELTSFYRDVLALQTGAGAEPINAEFADDIAQLARRTTPEATVGKLDAILACRTALETNVAPLLAMESLMLTLGGPG